MRFRLNFSEHRCPDATGAMVTYRAGDVIDTPHNLAAEFPILDVKEKLHKFTKIEDIQPKRPNFKRSKE